MKSHNKFSLLALMLLVSNFAPAARISQGSVCAAGAASCVSHDYLGQRPNSSNHDEGDLPWSTQAQGLAHDRDNWYVTNNASAFFTVNPTLRRIPVTTDLADGDVHCSDPGISCS